jgi:hypothetical protein
MASGTPEVDETTFSKQDDMATVGHGVTIDLGLNVDDRLRICLEPGYIDLDIEMANTRRSMRKKRAVW